MIRIFYTKNEMIKFGNYLLSDVRKNDLKKNMNEYVCCWEPFGISEHNVCDIDFKNWKKYGKK